MNKDQRRQARIEAAKDKAWAEALWATADDDTFGDDRWNYQAADRWAERAAHYRLTGREL